MNRRILIAYQLLTGLSDSGTGALLYVEPAFTLRLMGAHPPEDAMPYISYIGAFVFSVGLACLYGVRLVEGRKREKLEVVWLLTTFTRSAVAIYVVKGILSGELEAAWLSVALFDGACALVQAVGLRKKWLRHVE